MKRILLTKLKNTETADSRSKDPGYTKEGEFIAHPVVGQQFRMKDGESTCLITSRVSEIIDVDTFRTKNSIYKIKFLDVKKPKRSPRPKRVNCGKCPYTSGCENRCMADLS